MAQSASERRAAQRRLASDIKAGRSIFPAATKGQTKAAAALGYSVTDWKNLPPAERKELRDYVSNASKRIERFSNREPSRRKGDYRPEDWETWEWDMYREAMGL